MKYRRLSSDGDYSFGYAEADFLQDKEALAQSLKTKLLLFEGEWWENLNEGLPFFQQIAATSGKEEALNAVDLIIQTRILQSENVIGITSFYRTFNGNTRKYSATISVDTVYGTIAMEV